VLLANSSEALTLLGNSMEWRPGDEVLICDLEFPSNVIAWLRLREQGVRLVVVPSRNGAVSLDDWLAHLSPRTRLMCVSQVSYKTGTQFPYLPELARESRRRGAVFCLDTTQALGRVPVSISDVDFMVASSYKWLLGTHGLGVVYLAPEFRERIKTATAGWYSVESVFHGERFESFKQKNCAGQLQAGMPNFPAIFALHAGIEHLLGAEVNSIDASLRPLMSKLHSGLQAQGRTLLTPADRSFASGIVSIAHPQPESLSTKLAERGVIVWGGDGRVRFSVHLYNVEEDIQLCLDTLEIVDPIGNSARA
jgi:cysteine desulfurase/selenocysteine lyase